MQTLTLPTGAKVRYYAEIDEFPIERRTQWVKYLIESGGIDNTPSALLARLNQLAAMIQTGKSEDALITIQNLYFSVNAMEQGYNPSHLGFGCLVHSYTTPEGTYEVKDLSPDALRENLDALSEAGLTQADVDTIIEDVKKNFEPDANAISLGLEG